ncbi:MAG: glycosyltransferase family 39 protein [Chloroflexota bacterium]|nr:glycosyltransferase family 39 protein [Chloroflexota bacterium]
MKRERVISGLLLLIGVGFALLGQFYFTYRREYVWDGAFFWCVAILSFGLLLWRMGARGRGRPVRWLLALLRDHPRRALIALAGASFALLAGYIARRRPDTADFIDLLWLWLLGVTEFMLAFAPPFSFGKARERLSRWLRGNRVELTWLTALLLAALLVRAFDLEHIPANLGGDEGTQGMAALELLGPPLSNPFSTGWFAVPTMSFLWYGLGMRLFGESVAGLRAFSALAGALTVLTTFLLARELWGRRVGWLAAILLACSHYHIHFSRLGSNQIVDGLFITLALWLLARGLRPERAEGLRSRRTLYFALSGAVAGLGWYGYFGARLVGIIMALYLAWRWAAGYRFFARYGQLLLLLLIAALIVAAPLLLHFAQHPDKMTSRLEQVSIFASGWLEREQEITGRSAASLLLEQFWKSISAFNYTLDPTFWYLSSIPLLDFVSGALFVMGLLWVTAKYRWPSNGLLLAWFWAALILGWVLTENPPSSMRMTGIAPALSILVALGLNWLARITHYVLRITHYVSRFTFYASLVLIAILNLHYYFAVYTPTRVYGNPTAEIATELGRYLALQEDDYVVYFHAPPRMYWGFGALRFIAHTAEGMNVAEDALPEPAPARGARFVFLPHRLDELVTVRARYPGGMEQSVHSDADGRLLYVLYEVRETE